MIIKENINGIYQEREATAEEIAAMETATTEAALPTAEERIAALESAILELTEVIGDG